MANNKEQKSDSNSSWVIKVFITTFVLSIFFSYISTYGVAKLSLIPAFLILVLVILAGILFDIIGVAVSIANESEFHAKATKKVDGAKTSIKLIKNASKVSNFCADVIGDICGVLSGALSALVALKITEKFGFSDNLQFLISAIVASLTVSGKAIGKEIANKNSTSIVHFVGTFLNKFSK